MKNESRANVLLFNAPDQTLSLLIGLIKVLLSVVINSMLLLQYAEIRLEVHYCSKVCGWLEFYMLLLEVFYAH